MLFSAACLAVKCPGHGNVVRRCFCKAPVRKGLCVIWHAVKDPIDLHSNCVPVGPPEPRLSLHRSATGSHPRSGLREPEGGGAVSGFAVAGCPLSPPSRHTAASIHTDMFIRREREIQCLDSESSLKCRATVRELVTKKVLPKISTFFKPVSQLLIFLSVAACLIHRFPWLHFYSSCLHLFLICVSHQLIIVDVCRVLG